MDSKNIGKHENRISILDGFRAVAIIAVLFFHFFSRWLPPLFSTSLYPYQDRYNYFKFGYLGVNFFFIISGFVIFFTLEKTACYSSFWKKRMIRLLPSITVASIFIFIIFNLFDKDYLFADCHKAINFLPSLTFVDPHFYNTVFRLSVQYLNGSFWSLWPEVQFYFYVSLIYYVSRRQFVVNFIIISFIVIIMHYLMLNIAGSNKFNISLPRFFLINYKTWVLSIFNLPVYLPFFSLGMLFYLLYRNKQLAMPVKTGIKICMGILMAYTVYTGVHTAVRLLYVLMMLAFFCFIYLPHILFFLENKLLVKIGVSSYFLYLIHEPLGMLLIHHFGYNFLSVGFIFVISIMTLLIAISIGYTKYIDKQIVLFLKQ